jgi:hypothetical protein
VRMLRFSHAAVLALLAALLVCVSPASAAEPCPNEALREEQGSTALPDCRAYELVSPPDKHGADVIANTGRTRAAAGEAPGVPMAATFTSLGGFADEQGSGIASEYMAIRTANPGTSGWTTHGITPPQNSLTLLDDLQFFDPLWEGEMSGDLTQGVFRAVSPLTDSPSVANVANLYVRRDLRSSGLGSYQLLTDCVACGETPLPANFVTEEIPRLADASADFGHVIFESVQPLVPGATAIDDRQSGTFVPNLYEWDHGTLRLAGILPDDACGTPPCVASRSIAGQGAGGGIGGPSHGYTLRTISADGSRIFFTDGKGDLYMRIDHVSTVKINASEKSPPDTPRPASFQTASTDGTRIFFTTQEQLTNDDSDTAIDLYMYDTNAPSGQRLTRLSVDHEPADPPNDTTGVIGASNDGHYVYFLAAGQLVAGEPVPRGQGIYEWHDGTVSYVGALADPGIDVALGLDLPTSWAGPLVARVTPDGRHLLFVSHSGVGLTGYVQGNSCGPSSFEPSDGPCGELYVYSADSHQLACASCNPSGAPGTANARTAAHEGGGGSLQTWHVNHPLSDDGRHVFFSTAEALVPSDTNGKVDAYEYDVLSGTPHLLSSGKDLSNSYFMDASADGSDAFFVTRARLVGWDNDQNYDLYDARVGGGFPEPRLTPPACSGEACQGALSVPPSGPSFGSSLLTTSTGNAVPVSTEVSKPASKLQKLKKALKACKAKRSKARRRKCEATARKRFGKSARAK